MDKQLKDFLGDLIALIQEKYNETLIVPVDENSEDKCYRLGSNFAYYDVLDLVESQLLTQGFDSSTFEKISPILGEKI
ncbi:hypothetical protein IM700_014755 [Paenibacillus sp. DXFW5]|uniref:Uncharacterized protein n=1 Tax=Paenibacillus rhizolycopersici TaxID=2780073 RepID=A0ABS2HAL7_9BACL|nr:hypothetical protein [Paenibacillus rhizolycopersici]MBM6996915.1 hypothetical protein [Paenibacillus rhizolycopersici]